MALIYGIHFNNLRGGIYGGLTAAVVALPLALAKLGVNRRLPDGHHHVSRLDAPRQAAAAIAANGDPAGHGDD